MISALLVSKYGNFLNVKIKSPHIIKTTLLQHSTTLHHSLDEFPTTIYFTINFHNALHTENSGEITLECHYNDYSFFLCHTSQTQ